MKPLRATRYLLAAAAVLIASFHSFDLGAAPQQAATAPSTEAANHRALIDRYCVGCHNNRVKTADLALDTMDLAAVADHGDVWEKVIRKLRGGMMPPPGIPQPEATSITNLISWLEMTLDAAGAADPQPGRVVVHRMNRAEYQNAVRDLLAVEVDASALLPTDDISDGFDNVANVLKVSPSFLDQYINAARMVSIEAVGKPMPAEPAATTLPGGVSDLEDPFGPGGLPLGTDPALLTEHLFPADGDYEFAIPAPRGRGGRGGPAPGGGVALPPPGTVVTVDGVIVPLNERVRLTAGVHKVAMGTAPSSFVESDTLLQSFTPGLGGGGFGGGRGGGAAGLEVTGPYEPEGKLLDTASRRRIFTCRPADPASNAAEATACATDILTSIARRAFRRPVTETDLAGPIALYRDARTDGDFESGIQAGLMGILASPKFLYRSEKDPAGAEPGSNQQISDLELASRLSFFLWSSIPDDELLDLAEENKLSDPGVLEQQVRRMLDHPRAKALVDNFAFQWLKIREIDKIDPDQVLFPNFNAQLRAAFVTEIDLFVNSIVQEDRPVTDLLAASYTYVNERLARHYGIPDIFGDRFRRVDLADTSRYGLLGKGAVLMVTSYPNRTSSVLRGAWILEALTGTPPAAPPPDVEAFPETREGETAKTVRERMEIHRRNPTCNSCHGIMDPLGFALESFNAIGEFQTKDRYAQTLIDTSGKLVDGTEIEGVDDLREALLSKPDQFVQTMTERMLTYALGRRVEHFDMPAVRQIVRDAGQDNYRFSSIVTGIVTSLPFQMREVPPPATEAATETAARLQQ